MSIESETPPTRRWEAGFAFPGIDGELYDQVPGQLLWDSYAQAAITGLLAGGHVGFTPEKVTRFAAEIADDMIERRCLEPGEKTTIERESD